MGQLPAGRYLIESNFYLVVRPTGARSFVFRYTYAGRRRDLSLGIADYLRLSDAKKQAGDCRRLLAQGIDPKAARDAARSPKEEPVPVPTFKEFFESKLSELEKLKNYRSPRGFHDFKMRICRHVLERSELGSLQIDAITPADIAEAMAPLYEEKPITATKAAQNLSDVFRLAVRDGLRSDNPAIWKGVLDAFFPRRTDITTGHRAAPTLEELRAALINFLSQGVPTASAYSIVFGALTATRRQEWLKCFWSKQLSTKVESFIVTRYE